MKNWSLSILLLLVMPRFTWGQTIRIAKLENTPDHILGGMLLQAIHEKANVT